MLRVCLGHTIHLAETQAISMRTARSRGHGGHMSPYPKNRADRAL